MALGAPMTDVTGIVTQLTTANTTMQAILTTLQKGLVIQSVLPASTVAALPAVGSPGQLRFASNARKPGEGAGAGTGSFVYWNPATSSWFTTLNVVVTV